MKAVFAVHMSTATAKARELFDKPATNTVADNFPPGPVNGHALIHEAELEPLEELSPREVNDIGVHRADVDVFMAELSTLPLSRHPRFGV
jgi:hypothetical protein